MNENMKKQIETLFEIAKDEVKDYTENEYLGFMIKATTSIEGLVSDKKHIEAIEMYVKMLAVNEVRL